jgi:hypothetical protein
MSITLSIQALTHLFAYMYVRYLEKPGKSEGVVVAK